MADSEINLFKIFIYTHVCKPTAVLFLKAEDNSIQDC